MPASNNMQYWPSPHQQQHSPNQVTNFGNSSTYHQTGEPVYSLHQQPSATSNVYAGSHTNYGTINETTQDIYQYSPYSGDLLQPEEIFQLDQPIRSANVSSLTTAASTASSSPPATLLDLGSGTIEQKPLIYAHNDMADSYYNVHDENSTNSSHNNDTNCFYQSINDSIHLNNNNNNPTMVSMNAHHHLDATNTFASANYYCDTRRYPKQEQSYGGQTDAAHSPTLHSPTEQQICMEFQNAAVMNYSATNNNNNNNSNANNNNNSNFKGHKRKATDLIVFANAQQQYGAYTNQTPLHPTEYYGSDEHIAASNLDLHHPNNNGSPIISEYCSGSGGHPNQYVAYFSGADSGNDLAQLANNYQISVVNNWILRSSCNFKNVEWKESVAVKDFFCVVKT